MTSKEPQARSERRLINELFRRRVIQTVGIYLGATIAIMEFTDMMIERYAWAADIWDLVLLSLLLFLPTVLLLSWRHGAPGPDRWGRTEQIGIPLNLVSILAVLMLVLRSPSPAIEPLAAKITAVDETGSTLVRTAPAGNMIRHVGVFFPDIGPGLDDDSKWYSFALAALVSNHMAQDPFLDSDDLFDGYYNGQIWRLKREGYKDGLGVPLILQQRIAKSWNSRHFLSGTLARIDGLFVYDARLHEVNTLKMVASQRLENADFFELVDATSSWVRQGVDCPSSTKGMSPIYPASNLATADMDLLEKIVTGLSVRLFENDSEKALRIWNSVLEESPNIARLHILVGEAHSDLGRTQEALSAFKSALRHDFGLHEWEKFHTKARKYFLENKVDKAIAVLNTWIDLYPEDPAPLNNMAKILLNSATKPHKALMFMMKSLEMDDSQDNILLSVGKLYRILGDDKRAADFFQRYSKRRPDEYLPLVNLADLKIQNGQLTEAKELLQQATVVSPSMVTPSLRMSNIEIRDGNFLAAREWLDDAYDIAAAPRQENVVLAGEIELLRMRGQIGNAIELARRQREVGKSFMDPIWQLNATVLNHLALFHEAGELDEILAIAQAFEEQNGPPFDAMSSMAYLFSSIVDGRIEDAKRQGTRLIQLGESAGRQDLLIYAAHAQGRILAAEGRHEDAIAYFRHVLTLFDTTFLDAESDKWKFDVLLGVARSERALGHYDLAQQALDQIFMRWPDYPFAIRENISLAQAQENPEVAADLTVSLRKIWIGADQRFLEVHDFTQAIDTSVQKAPDVAI